MARSEFDAFCRDVFGFLDACGVRYLVIGGLAVIVVGEPRTTADADVIAFLDSDQAAALLRRAKKAGYKLDLKMERASIEETGTLCLGRGRFHLDIILASLPLEEDAYRRSKRKKLFGRLLRFPSPEDLIVFKVLAGDEKDLIDAVGIIRRHSNHLDRSLLESMIRPLCDLAQDMGPWNRLQYVLKKGGTRI